MEDLQLYVERLNGDVMEENRLFTSFNPRATPDPLSIIEEIWGTAEQTTSQEVLSCIHPTLDSEEKRKDVIEYVQRLIRCSIGVEVSPYGSVPLKTYLPDGDIDLTVLSSPIFEDSLPCDVLRVMHAEQLNDNVEYEVRDTQFIDAEVKLVKCLVQNIVIDISFNQLGGLSTLCFLEQVDRLVGKDHLFKRSIILIKAWCYYESRILGAHHGLISTYALESLILYIFHLFNSSLNGPLAVLYRFLDYFSKFDWENYCISLNGPVCKSSLPDIVVENLENGEDLMLSEEFLRNCVDMFSVSSRALETNLRVFPMKYLNIIDPLKENNNLGRSVHRGNFYRIRSAFKYGARKLGRILLLPRERIADEIKKFFESTLERHGHKDAAQIIGRELGSLSFSALSNDDMHLSSTNGTIDEDMLRVEYKISSGFRNELDRYLKTAASSQMVLACSPERTVVSGDRLAGDVNDPVTYRSLRSRNTNVASDCSPLQRDSNDSLFTSHNAPGLCVNNFDSLGFSDSVISSPDDNVSDNLSIEFREKALDSIAGDIETLNLSDLTGDYDNHVRSLLYGQCCHGYALSLPALCSPPSSSLSQFQNEPSDTAHRYMPLKRLTNTNGAALGKPLPSAKNHTPSIDAFGLDKRDRTRGTGTYIPIPDCYSFRKRTSQGRRNQAQEIHCQLQKHGCNDGTNSSEEGGHKLTKAKSTVLGHGEPGLYHQPLHVMSDNFHGNGISISNRILEFGSFGPLPEGSGQLALGNSNARGSTSSLTATEEQNPKQVKGQLALGNSNARGSTSSITAAEEQNPKQVKGRKQRRIVEKSLNLENEDDFPPLS